MSIEVKDLSKSFDGKRVLSGLSFTLPETGVVEIYGPSGGGKTTLLRLLMGLETPDGGEIRGLEGKKFSAVFQEDRLLTQLDAVSNVRFASRVGAEEARACLAWLGLMDLGAQRVASMSGGMKRRVAIARALCAGGDVLVLDEPFKGLDEDTRAKTMECVLRRAAGMLILLVTHDRAEGRAMGAQYHLKIGGDEA